MSIVNKDNKEQITKRMIRHYADTKTEEEIRKQIEENPRVLEDFAEYEANRNYEEIELRSYRNIYYE